MPAPGRIAKYREPSGPGVRVDSGVGPGSEISQNYDPMIAKLIVWDSDRAAATRRMLRALGEFEITGLHTLIPFHQRLLATEQWSRGETCRDLLEDDAWLASIGPGAEPTDADVDSPGEQALTLDYTVEVSGRRFDVRVSGPPGGATGRGGAAAAKPARARRTTRASTPGAAGGGDVLRSPMQGTVLKVAVEAGATVAAGTLIAVIEAMKMENEITAHKDGTVTALPISVGSSVASGDTLAVIEST
jgi:acetyl-CoA/propionyl-CoA carboxylase biotin carboxyl carrier protein